MFFFPASSNSAWRAGILSSGSVGYSWRIPITYAIVTGTSKVKLKPWCCRLFSIHGHLRGFENTILARVLFLLQERTWQRPLEPFLIPLCVSVHKSTKWNQNISEKFQWLLLADRSAHIYLRSVTSGVIVCLWSNHCHIQILDVSHDCVRQSPSPSPI